LENLLQKNFFLAQSARDGYRSYLQSYASYSLKKIFDVNKLDLQKVGKAFGFTVPPRVNINFGGGTGGTGKSGKKRKRDDEDDDDDGDDDAGGSGSDDQEETEARSKSRSQSKNRRKEQLGAKKVDKEVYRKNQKSEDGTQWSR